MPYEHEVYNANLAMFCRPMPIHEPFVPLHRIEFPRVEINEPRSYLECMSYRKTEADIYNENLSRFSAPMPALNPFPKPDRFVPHVEDFGIGRKKKGPLDFDVYGGIQCLTDELMELWCKATHRRHAEDEGNIPSSSFN